MPKNNLFLVVFQAATTSGCDYATQTIASLSKTHMVIGLAIGEPVSWRDVFSFTKKKKIITWRNNMLLVRPFFIIPGQRFMFIQQANISINALLLKAYIRLRHGQRNVYLWFFEPFFIPQLLDIFSSYISIFDCVDYFLTVKPPFLSHMKVVLRRATHVFVNSTVLKNKLKPYRHDITVVPLGFAHSLFRRHQHVNKRIAVHPVRVGFVGGIDNRLDYRLLYHTAISLREVKFVFVGKNDLLSGEAMPHYKAFRSLPNVEFLDEKEKIKMPGVIQTFDICLIPYDIKQAFNRYCFPMKTFEYFYYGKPVISTDIVELRRFKEMLIIIHSYKELIRKIRYVIKKGWLAERKRREKSIAIANSWDNKIRKIFQLLHNDLY